MQVSDEVLCQKCTCKMQYRITNYLRLEDRKYDI